MGIRLQGKVPKLKDLADEGIARALKRRQDKNASGEVTQGSNTSILHPLPSSSERDEANVDTNMNAGTNHIAELLLFQANSQGFHQSEVHR